MRPPSVLTLLLVAWLVGGCAVATPSATPIVSVVGEPAVTVAPSVAPSSPTPSPTDAPSEAAAGGLDPDVPTACLSLGDAACARARAAAAATLTPADPPVRYVQVGPFGCVAGERCPTTLEARPEGDVTFEFPDGTGVTVHLVVAPDGTATTTRDAALGVAVPPSSAAGLAAGPDAFTLGHCGVWSGIDLDGAWWDPVGPVDMDSGDAVNATTGVIVATDPTHAIFTAPSGFALQLQRRVGSKFLPFCM